EDPLAAKEPTIPSGLTPSVAVPIPFLLQDLIGMNGPPRRLAIRSTVVDLDRAPAISRLPYHGQHLLHMPTRRGADKKRLLGKLGARCARERCHQLRRERLPAPDPREFRGEREYFFRGESERTTKGPPARDGEAVCEQAHREAGQPRLVLVSHADQYL